MTNDNEETRSYESILADNKELMTSNEILQLQVAQLRQKTADYQRAQVVAEAMAANNDVLRSVDSSTYQVRGEEVDVEFGRFMFCKALVMLIPELADYEQAATEIEIQEAIEAWKTREETK